MAGICVSMDGRGRVFDNIFIERLWRTVKYEDIYIKEYTSVPALVAGLEDYFYLYNYERPHQSLGATGYPLTIILLLARLLEV
jgi:putative transposase